MERKNRFTTSRSRYFHHKNRNDEDRKEKKRSATLQRKLFEQFQILNAHGETKDLCRIFAQTIQKNFLLPEPVNVQLPKLLQYAYKHQLKPIAMAEFWWGRFSKKQKIRHHGYYYPACKGKMRTYPGTYVTGTGSGRKSLVKKNIIMKCH